MRDAPPRTVSGGLQYSTDTGFGVRGAWENRNLFGGGEQLRVTAPISEDSQSLNASFRKPAFGIRDQALVGEAWAINETTDAYDRVPWSFAAALSGASAKIGATGGPARAFRWKRGASRTTYPGAGDVQPARFSPVRAPGYDQQPAEPDHRDAGDP